MSPPCFLRERIKNIQKKTVITLCGRTGFLEEIDIGLETGSISFLAEWDSLIMAKSMSYFNIFSSK